MCGCVSYVNASQKMEDACLDIYYGYSGQWVGIGMERHSCLNHLQCECMHEEK